jgi:hypothetical protein
MKDARPLPSLDAEAVNTRQPRKDIDQDPDRDLERRSLRRVRELSKCDPVDELAHDEHFVAVGNDLTDPTDIRVS